MNKPICQKCSATLDEWDETFLCPACKASSAAQLRDDSLAGETTRGDKALQSDGYRTIVADPPWEYEGFVPSRTGDRFWHRDLPYGMMTLEEIAELPVHDWAAKDCRLFLWTTNRYLGAAFDIARRWGFEYQQAVVWRKTGNPSPMGGSVAPNHAEYLLVCRRGFPPRLERWASSVVDAPKGAHSKKPELFLDLIEQVSPSPRLEMFARRQRLGWDTWGNEALNHVEVA